MTPYSCKRYPPDCSRAANNSYCDKESCICNVGHIYDYYLDDCILDVKQYGPSCHSNIDCKHLNMICNQSIGFCQCKPEYNIFTSSSTPCLDFKYYGQQCIHSSQCWPIINGSCINDDNIELNRMEFIKHWLKNKEGKKTVVHRDKKIF